MRFCTFVQSKHKFITMKKLPIIALLAVGALSLQSNTPLPALTSHLSEEDTLQILRDTTVAVKDTLEEVEVKGKGLTVVDAINKSLKKQMKQPGKKSVSDIIGAKATDYIMHPFAWKQRRKEKQQKRTQENLKKLDAAKTYEDELTEAIYRQLREDSIANAKKEQEAKK